MKGYRDNGGVGGGLGARNKTVYDDVFGGPPKFGATTLPPRLEDYTEIFQGFHASRGSSIPVLDLPPPSNDSDDVWFDVQSSKLDYSEVFGGFNGLDFAISYEELFKISKVGDGDSSDDLWTPAQSETLSDELDPYASLEMNQNISNTDPIELFGVQLQNEPDFEAEKDLSYDSQFLDSPRELEDEKLFSLADSDHSSSNHRVVERKQLKKSFSQPLDSVYDTERYKQHVSVCDLSLKTQPSNLPPPSRPPPVLSSKKGDTFKLKTSKSYAFEKVRGDRSPPYFDVEIDASSSSASADAAAMKDAVEQAQAKLKSAKESMDRKKESLQIRLKSNVGDKKERVNGDERSNGFGCKITKGSLEKDNNTVRRHEAIDENQHMKMKDVEGSVCQNSCKPSESEKTCLPSQQSDEMKTVNEVDESELCDNLIEIQLKDNDMEVVNKKEVKYDNGRRLWEDDDERTLWEDYDNTFGKKDYDEEVEESKEQEEKAGPPEIVIISESKEEEDESEKAERIVEDSYNWEENESDKISETASEKEQKLNHKEKILEKEDEGHINEKTEMVDCNSEEDTKSQEDHESEESEKKEQVVSENDWDISDVVYTVNNDDNEILQTSQNIPQDITSDKIEVTQQNQVPVYPTNPEKNENQVPIYPTNPEINEARETNNVKNMIEERPVEMKENRSCKLKNVTNMKTSTNSNNERKDVIDKLLRERELESERIRKQEEERERQIEREKDRMAMDRATLEARERAFSETKSGATAEYRQRALAETRERLEKACAEARERSLAEKTMEGRLRVEKATAEARERAERSVRYNGGAENESPQRCKARLERHQRTADRAAKALAEKNMRDLLAQKEQAERNRLSEGLDAEVKRWCGGKQGNLRALLSTLQYILGPDSGWQPIPLTEVITTAAAKKAYRKATLCVHPDKLQQRGATIQQKYICEKVFDLLKEAWNKFNSEER